MRARSTRRTGATTSFPHGCSASGCLLPSGSAGCSPPCCWARSRSGRRPCSARCWHRPTLRSARPSCPTSGCRAGYDRRSTSRAASTTASPSRCSWSSSRPRWSPRTRWRSARSSSRCSSRSALRSSSASPSAGSERSAIAWGRSSGAALGYWLEIALVGLAVGAYAIATPLGGSGFIAAWVAGLRVRQAVRVSRRRSVAGVRRSVRRPAHDGELLRVRHLSRPGAGRPHAGRSCCTACSA